MRWEKTGLTDARSTSVLVVTAAFMALMLWPVPVVGASDALKSPSNTNAIATSDSRIDVSWQDNSARETGFEIHRSSGDGVRRVATTAADVTARGDPGLNPSTQYCYKVRAFKTSGGRTSYSDFSNTACATTPASPVPTAPSGADAKPEGSVTVAVRWIDNSNNEDGFRVERSIDLGSTWASLGTVGPNITSRFNSVTSEQQVCYRVMAFNGGGISPPSNTDCTTAPATPTNLTASAVDQQTIVFMWNDNSAVEDGYEVWRRTDGVAYGAVAILPANSTSYRDVGVTSDATYWYIVRAMKDGGFSDFSNYWGPPASAVVATVAPNAPRGVHPIPWGSSAVGVTWTENSTNEVGFRVERSTDGGGGWVTVGTSWFAAYYPYQFVDGDRIREEQVCYRVVAYNDAGDSPPSSMACTVPPAGPTNLTATTVAEGVQVTWTDNSAFEDGYYVVLITDCAEQSDYWIWLPANSTSYLDTSGYWCFGPTLGYYVIATKDGGWSDWSNSAPHP